MDVQSNKQDPALLAAGAPGGPGGAPLAVMDGHCALCSWGARMIARHDRSGSIRICKVQSDLGQQLLQHFGVDGGDPETWLFIEDGRAYSSFDAMIRAGRIAGRSGLLLQPLRLLPRTVQDWLYRRIARNRYRMFGRADMCALPDGNLRARIIG